MSKYIIEGGINFYEELYKSLDKNDTKEDDSKEEELCQITGLPLTDKYVTMECNHKFNYGALYKEICKQKYIFRTYNFNILSNFEQQKFKDANVDYFIKCPYCRNIQFSLLPYYEDSEYEEKYGINSFAKTHNDNNFLVKPIAGYNYQYMSYGYMFQPGTCCKIIDTKNGINVFCPAKYSGLVPEMSKSFCITHIRAEVKQYKLDKKAKEKLLEKQEKEKMKLEKQQQKELEKQQKQLEKKQKKPLTNVVLSQNIQIGEFVNDNELGTNANEKENMCCAVLKSGLKKGKQCGATVKQNGLCLRHQIKDKTEI